MASALKGPCSLHPYGVLAVDLVNRLAEYGVSVGESILVLVHRRNAGYVKVSLVHWSCVPVSVAACPLLCLHSRLTTACSRPNRATSAW